MAQLTPQVSELLEKALALSTQERGLLIDKLIASLDEAPEVEGVETAWDEEIKRRVGDIRSGRVKTIPGEQVIRELAEEFPDGWILRRLKSRLRHKGVVDFERWFAALDQFNPEPFPQVGTRRPVPNASPGRRRSRRNRA